MSGRARWFRLALGTSILGVTFALSGCGAAALPPPPPPGTATSLASATQAPATSPTKATGAPTTAATASSVSPAQIAAGKSAFATTCGGCHISTAAGTLGQVGPSLNGIGALHDAAWILVQIQNPCAPGHSNAAGPKYSCATMPPNMVSGATAQAIAAFLASQK
jgi:mono/diheme cytochrome c family protein